jgi:hypothetical protein
LIGALHGADSQPYNAVPRCASERPHRNIATGTTGRIRHMPDQALTVFPCSNSPPCGDHLRRHPSDPNRSTRVSDPNCRVSPTCSLTRANARNCFTCNVVSSLRIRDHPFWFATCFQPTRPA